jgi:hypothetical protein
MGSFDDRDSVCGKRLPAGDRAAPIAATGKYEDTDDGV